MLNYVCSCLTWRSDRKKNTSTFLTQPWLAVDPLRGTTVFSFIKENSEWKFHHIKQLYGTFYGAVYPSYEP